MPVLRQQHRTADAERQVQMFCQHLNISLVILRVPGIYGPGKLPLSRIKSSQPIVNKHAVITLASEPHPVVAGESIIMPANVPHAVSARSDFKMLLTMLKD